MPDTPRTRSALVALLPDNGEGQISAQDLRDFLASVPIVQFGDGPPTVAAEQVADHYYDQTNGILYSATATGLSPSIDEWEPINPSYKSKPNIQYGIYYELQLSDRGRTVISDSASANVIIIPTDEAAGFDENGILIAVIQVGAGQTTIEAASGVTLNGVTADSPSVIGTINNQYGGVTLYKRGTNEWVAVGDISDVA